MPSEALVTNTNLNNNTNYMERRGLVMLPNSSNPKNENGVSECFHKVSTCMYVSLAPMFVCEPIKGIKIQHLDNLIMTYYPKVEGVILAYEIVSLSNQHKSMDEEGNDITLLKISESSPFTFLWLTVEFLVWKPQVGDTLEGNIFMQTASHIGLLVHETFNASIKKYCIPSDWRFVPIQADEYADENESKHFKSCGYWEGLNGVKIDGKLKFIIKAIHSTGKMVTLEGSLIQPGMEKDFQPVTRLRRSSSSSQHGPKHKKFDDRNITEMTELPELENGEMESEPVYIRLSDQEGEDSIINEADSDSTSS